MRSLQLLTATVHPHALAGHCTPVRRVLTGTRGVLTGTRGVLTGTRGVLPGYSRGTRRVLTGYSQGTFLRAPFPRREAARQVRHGHSADRPLPRRDRPSAHARACQPVPAQMWRRVPARTVGPSPGADVGPSPGADVGPSPGADGAAGARGGGPDGQVRQQGTRSTLRAQWECPVSTATRYSEYPAGSMGVPREYGNKVLGVPCGLDGSAP